MRVLALVLASKGGATDSHMLAVLRAISVSLARTAHV